MIVKKYLKFFLLGLCILLVELCFYHYGLDYNIIFDFIKAYPIWAPLIFILACMLAMIGLIPTLPFNLGAGILFGGVYGGILSTIGSALGSIASFVIAKYITKDYAERLFDNRLMHWVNTELNTNGWRIVAFVRLCPGVPTGPINYVFGLTGMRLRTYSWVTFVFLFPPSLVISIMGQHLGTYYLGDTNINTFRLVITLTMGTMIILFAIPFLFKSIFKMKNAEKMDQIKHIR